MNSKSLEQLIEIPEESLDPIKEGPGIYQRLPIILLGGCGHQV